MNVDIGILLLRVGVSMKGVSMKNDTHLYGIGRCQFSYGLYRILYGYIAYARIFTKITSRFFEPESRQNPMKCALFNMTPWISLTHPKISEVVN